ncbi:DUF4362 domain-containing protein [Paenibacillus sp. GCM10027628]|uniref:DUF4362 domain-containing protein n=1 Tax=Paenibacillus sp. GCM10027628 TaxID=3273413 RepID=UPI00363D6E79
MRRILLIILSMLLLSSCNTYDSNKAKENGDIIPGHPGPVNLDKIDIFIKDFETQKESKIRITSYTEEGDPIISDLNFNGKEIEYIFDNSRDKHGGKQKGKYDTTCKSIEKKNVTRGDSARGVEYILTNCKEIIGIHYSEKQEIYLMFKAQ